MRKILIMLLCLFMIGCSLNEEYEEVEKSEKEDLEVKEEFNYGIFNDYYNLALKKVSGMTKEEKVGQMIFARLPQSNVKEVINNYHVGE